MAISGTTRVQRWALVSATAAPILLIGGWTLAAMLAPPGFDPARDTISALAALGATDRWLMTGALLLLGVCHITTASGFREAARPGRIILAIGGAATIGVALFPLPVVGNSTAHAVFAFIAFGCLAAWPFFAWRRAQGTSWALRAFPSNAAAAVLVMLLVVFIVALAAGVLVGATERLAAGAQAIWPLVAVWCARRAEMQEIKR